MSAPRAGTVVTATKNGGRRGRSPKETAAEPIPPENDMPVQVPVEEPVPEEPAPEVNEAFAIEEPIPEEPAPKEPVVEEPVREMGPSVKAEPETVSGFHLPSDFTRLPKEEQVTATIAYIRDVMRSKNYKFSMDYSVPTVIRMPRVPKTMYFTCTFSPDGIKETWAECKAHYTAEQYVALLYKAMESTYPRLVPRYTYIDLN